MKLSAMGLEVADSEFTGASRLLLRALGRVPGSLTERILFGQSPASEALQKVVQRLIAGPRAVRVHFTAGPIAGCDFDCSTAERYFMLGARYEAAVTSVLRTVVQRSDVVYDVGAHAGFSSLLFAGLASGGQVYAFEPSPILFESLARNVALNTAAHVTPINAGVWDSEGRLRLVEHGTCSRVIAAHVETESRVSDVALLRLDDFAYRDGHRPATVMKIDVEGDGARCLAGARELLARSRPRLLLEVHDATEERESRDILDAHRYRISPIDTPRRYPYHLLARADGVTSVMSQSGRAEFIRAVHGDAEAK